MFSLLLLKNAAGTCHWQNDSTAGNYLEQHEKGKCISIYWNRKLGLSVSHKVHSALSVPNSCNILSNVLGIGIL